MIVAYSHPLPLPACMLHYAFWHFNASILHNILVTMSLYACLAAYILPSSPVCCIYTALIPCLAYKYTALVSQLFGIVIPTSFNMKCFYSPVNVVLATFVKENIGKNVARTFKGKTPV